MFLQPLSHSMFHSQDSFLNMSNHDNHHDDNSHGEEGSSNNNTNSNRNDLPFTSSDYAALLKSKDSMFNSSDFAAKLLKSRDGKDGFASMDFLKSLDFQSKDASAPMTTRAATAAASKNAGVFSSRDWMDGYETGHVDIPYDKTALFRSGSSSLDYASMMGVRPSSFDDADGALPPPMPGRAALVPSLSDMYKDVLSNPMQTSAAPAVEPPMPPLTVEPKPVPPVVAPLAAPSSSTAAAPLQKKKKRIYKSRKVVPSVKTYVDYTDHDVLLGRGGLSNKHPGNHRYRSAIEDAKDVYRSAVKDEKTKWAELLVESVHQYGGRFLEKDKTPEGDKWYIVPDIVARRKAGQALREDNTPESRKEKRDRYKRRHNKR